MLGVVYLLLNVFTGFVFCSLAFPKLGNFTLKTYRGTALELNPLIFLAPVWYVSGAIFMSWGVYLLASVLAGLRYALLYSNLIIMVFAVIIDFIAIYFLYIDDENKRKIPHAFKHFGNVEILFLSISFLFITLMMTRSFFVAHNQLYIGLSVFSDFTPHVSMMRSFTYGYNFPAQYSFFAGEDIRYHFMFQFMAGNLEYLGLRIDQALNIPSILGLFGTLCLLYVYAVKISGKKVTGYLTCFLFMFRSSFSLFRYIAEEGGSEGILALLTQNNEFIGYSTNENWGLWNLNVYLNQRHLAFALVILLFILMIFTDQVYEMAERVFTEEKSEKKKWYTDIRNWFSKSLFSKEGWLPKDITGAVCAGILLGSLGFFNGAVLIATVCVLFFFAVVADRRLEYLIVAVIAGGLSFLQTSNFINGSAVKVKYQYGFIAENTKNWIGVTDYVVRLLGLLPFVLLAAFATYKFTRRYLMFAFSAPLIMAFTVSMTIDVTVNHKYIMISVMLLDIFAAIFIVNLLRNKKLAVRLLCILMIFMLTATGIYDFYIIHKKNSPNRSMVYNLEDPLTDWIHKNANASDIFLTSNYYLTYGGYNGPLILGGAMLYQGWQYYAWSAGYDTAGRDQVVKLIYSCDDIDMLNYLVRSEGIRYIVIDKNNRTSEEYELNESIFYNAYTPVYRTGEGIDTLVIFDTYKPAE